ncbi:unnamed protein product [Cylindrotheca closterium]|uniref:Uncharacterized protein n=1 Tax=Cylindrotheca closterium TaxID=2856 RepID=A0AAD2PWE5_9STRA|nr:unnamed protein product [Cylindrotheca closterium]
MCFIGRDSCYGVDCLTVPSKCEGECQEELDDSPACYRSIVLISRLRFICHTAGSKVAPFGCFIAWCRYIVSGSVDAFIARISSGSTGFGNIASIAKSSKGVTLGDGGAATGAGAGAGWPSPVGACSCSSVPGDR